jgi:hypothetical protein
LNSFSKAGGTVAFMISPRAAPGRDLGRLGLGMKDRRRGERCRCRAGTETVRRETMTPSGLFRINTGRRPISLSSTTHRKASKIETIEAAAMAPSRSG